MQRIAMIAALLSAALVVGCAQNKRDVEPLPEPLTATRPPPPKRAAASPPKQTAKPAPTPAPQPSQAAGLRPWEWMPKQGIKPGLWKTIVVHHSDSEKATPASMNAWHLQRGWENGLGYHFVIGNGVNYPDGEIYVGKRWKQQIAGAHCRSGAGKFFGLWRPSGFFNDHGIGICLIGDFERQRPTPKQMAALAELIGFLCDKTGIPPSQIYGHGDVTNKTACPGRYLNIAAVRNSVKAVLASSD